MSPDGQQIVYVRQWIDPVTDTRKSSLWIMNGDGSQNRSLTEGDSPRWSPSGDRLAFLACGTPGGDPGALIDCEGASRQQVYVRIMTGRGEGAVTQVTRLQESASNITWIPDGSTIAFNQFVPRNDAWTVDLPGRPSEAQWTGEPRIVDRLDYRQDRQGLTRNGYQHIFTVPADGGTPPPDHAWGLQSRISGLESGRKRHLLRQFSAWRSEYHPLRRWLYGPGFEDLLRRRRLP